MRKIRSEDEIIKGWNGASNPVAGIFCFAYNQEKYIEDALEGFLIQETDFPFEILIQDDASTDNTASIIREYEAAYPRIIKPVYNTENQYSKEDRPCFSNFSRSKGEYIAYCDGDDYWTDPLKLQKQVNFLNINHEYSMCSHNVRFVWDGVEENSNYYGKSIEDADFKQILEGDWFIALNSLVFRKKYFLKGPDWYTRLRFGAHKALVLMISAKGRNHHFSEAMAVKRRNPNGVTILQKKWRDENRYIYNIEVLEHLKDYLNHEQDYVINKKLSRICYLQSRKEIKKLKFFQAFYYMIKAVKTYRFK